MLELASAELAELVHGALEFAVDHGFVSDQAVQVGGGKHDTAGKLHGLAGDGTGEGGHGGVDALKGVFDR